MNSLLHINILSLHNQYTYESKMIILPGEQGVLGVLPKHMNLIVNLKAGIIEVHGINNEIDRIYISRGVAQINNNACNIVVNHCNHFTSKTDNKLLKERIQDIENLLRHDHNLKSCIKQSLQEEVNYLRVQI